MAVTETSKPTPESFSVAIVGGGIGGLAMAISVATHIPSLKHITVYEQASAYKEIGAGIGINVNSARILQRYGVYDAANAISGDRNGIHRSLRRWDNGEEIVTVKAMDDEEEKTGGVRQLSVHRAGFLKVLYDHLVSMGRAKLETGKKAVEIVDSVGKNGKATVRFADGTSATADLIIACDGIHSNIRGQLSNADDKAPRYSGRICYRGLLPLSAVSENWPHESFAVSWLGPNRHFLVFPISNNHTLNVVAFVSKEEAELGDLKESWTSTAPREEVQAEFSDWDETVQNVLRHMDPNPGKWKLNDRELLNKWVYLNGKVVLSGDAAHAMLPHQGSGAGHAIEDSFVLGQALAAFFENPTPGLEAYMNLYQATRLPRAQKAQLTSRQAGDVYEMQGPDFAGLTFEEGLLVIRKNFQNRMGWIWGHDLEADFKETRAREGL